MLKTLYLIRHGETEWNDQWRLQGQRDIPLSSKGILQAKKAAESLQNKDIDVIYCSDLSRAVQTAEIISAGRKGGEIQVYKTKKLREISFGDWEGKKFEEISQQEKEHYLRWLQDPVSCAVPGGESMDAVKQRVMHFVEGILKNNDKNIMVVSHGGPVKIMISQVLNMDPAHLSRLVVSPASISIIQYYKTDPYLVLFNEVCHLKDKKQKDST